MDLGVWGLVAGLAVPLVTLFGLLWNSNRLPGSYRRLREAAAALGSAKDDPEAKAALSGLVQELTAAIREREKRVFPWRSYVGQAAILLWAVVISMYGYRAVSGARGTPPYEAVTPVLSVTAYLALGAVLVYAAMTALSIRTLARARRERRTHARDVATAQRDDSLRDDAPPGRGRAGRASGSGG